MMSLAVLDRSSKMICILYDYQVKTQCHYTMIVKHTNENFLLKNLCYHNFWASISQNFIAFDQP